MAVHSVGNQAKFKERASLVTGRQATTNPPLASRKNPQCAPNTAGRCLDPESDPVSGENMKPPPLNSSRTTRLWRTPSADRPYRTVFLWHPRSAAVDSLPEINDKKVFYLNSGDVRWLEGAIFPRLQSQRCLAPDCLKGTVLRMRIKTSSI